MHGPINFESIKQSKNFTCCQDDDNLHKMVKQQFNLENFGVSLTKVDKTKSIEDERAHLILQNSIKMLNGRFQLNLPWKKDDTKLPQSKQMAMQRLKFLERKLDKNNFQATVYQSEITKLWGKKGYATKVEDIQVLSSKKLWFLPHFAISANRIRYESYLILQPNQSAHL